jgi:hypothetical protein
MSKEALNRIENYKPVTEPAVAIRAISALTKSIVILIAISIKLLASG